MTTVTEAPVRRALSRAQAADELLKILTDEPQSAASLRRQVMPDAKKAGAQDVVRNGLGVLEARHLAKHIPRGPGQSGGWVRFESKLDASIEKPEEVSFPYEWQMVRCDEMFIDRSYQRPLTNFVDKIESKFDPVLFQVLAVSDRGRTNKPKRFSVIDGQTRWVAATRRGIVDVPCIVFVNLTAEQEANMFARLQTQRRGMLSWHRFRADLRAMKPEALAIKQLVEGVGYELGDGVNQLKAVGALESCYRKDPYLLQRCLADLKDGWGDRVPEGPHIRGLHYLFRRFPIANRKKQDIDDVRLVRRLKTNDPDTLKRKAILQKQAATKQTGSAEKWMGMAFEQVYVTGG